MIWQPPTVVSLRRDIQTCVEIVSCSVSTRSCADVSQDEMMNAPGKSCRGCSTRDDRAIATRSCAGFTHSGDMDSITTGRRCQRAASHGIQYESSCNQSQPRRIYNSELMAVLN